MNHWLKRGLTACLSLSLAAVSFFAPSPFFSAPKAAEAQGSQQTSAGGNPMTAAPTAAMRLIVDRYASTGELSPALAEQLRYRLSIIDVLVEQRAFGQAEAYTADMLAYIHDPSVLQQNLITATAVSALETESAGFLQTISTGTGQLTLVDNGAAKAVIVVPPVPNAEAMKAAQRLAD